MCVLGGGGTGPLKRAEFSPFATGRDDGAIPGTVYHDELHPDADTRTTRQSGWGGCWISGNLVLVGCSTARRVVKLSPAGLVGCCCRVVWWLSTYEKEG